MRIQHNISALNTHRNLAFNNTQTSKALEKLSSGYKINRAGDDAAGLAISEKMRGQIRGLDMAAKNAQDGISLIQTTEGALNETQAILQRMRELAVQAGNDTNTTEDRGEIQKEINQLTSEINRIGNTTEFNKKTLLNGDLSSAKLASGATPTTVTRVTAKDGDYAVGKTPITWTSGSKADFDITITGAGDNGFDWSKLSGAASGTVTLEIERTASGFTVTTPANLQTSGSGGSLNINADALDYDADTDTYSYDSQGIKFQFTTEEAKDWKVSGKVTIDLARHRDQNSGNVTAKAIDVGSKTQSYTDAAVSGGNTVFANGEIAVSGSDLDGLAKVNFSYTGASGADSVVVTLQNASGGQLAQYKFETSGPSGHVINFDANGVKFDLTVGSGASSGTFTLEQNDPKTTVLKAADTEDKSLKFQIGANENQALSVSVEDMRAKALGIVGTAGASGFTTGLTVNDGTNATGTEAALDLSSHENAARAITVIDEAINKVSSERAKLGAVQNRLEHTINNLGASSENLTAAESRIRDTDMAKEMMNFTKNNILTQAAQSMLAQANQQPQGVLQLLG